MTGLTVCRHCAWPVRVPADGEREWEHYDTHDPVGVWACWAAGRNPSLDLPNGAEPHPEPGSPPTEAAAWFPHVEAALFGQDHDADALVCRVVAALRHGNVPEDDIATFRTHALSGGYMKTVRVAIRWIEMS